VRYCVSLTVACFPCSSPAFLDKITVHIAKNFLELPKIKVPLILGIWGGKGQGKTFQCTLAYKKLGINPVVMSAGELESGNAGEPAKPRAENLSISVVCTQFCYGLAPAHLKTVQVCILCEL